MDIVVPIDKTADFITFINDLQDKTGMRMVSFGHAGDGNVHLCVVRGEPRRGNPGSADAHANMDLAYHKACTSWAA